jgi:hypothetical protein
MDGKVRELPKFLVFNSGTESGPSYSVFAFSLLLFMLFQFRIFLFRGLYFEVSNVFTVVFSDECGQLPPHHHR